MREISCVFTFEAAHRLTKVHPNHKCARLHGHSFRAEVFIRTTELDERDMVIDFDDVRGAFQPLHVSLDHNFLNEISGLENPTSEVIAAWIFERMNKRFEEMRIALSCARVTVSETPRSSASFP